MLGYVLAMLAQFLLVIGMFWNMREILPIELILFYGVMMSLGMIAIISVFFSKRKNYYKLKLNKFKNIERP